MIAGAFTAARACLKVSLVRGPMQQPLAQSYRVFGAVPPKCKKLHILYYSGDNP